MQGATIYYWVAVVHLWFPMFVGSCLVIHAPQAEFIAKYSNTWKCHSTVSLKYCLNLLPMVPVGSPTGWCLPSPCVQWGKATCPSAVFLPTPSTNETTWISTNTGLCVCVVYVHGMGVGVALYPVLISILKSVLKYGPGTRLGYGSVHIVYGCLCP